ncbi:MAG: hypothetical protein ABSE73_04040 [Planctomycetota bacterium]
MPEVPPMTAQNDLTQLRSRQKEQQRRAIVLCIVVVLSLFFTAFWSCDRAGLFYGRSEVMGQLLQFLWFAAAAWIPLSFLVAIHQTDRKNFVYLLSLCVANLNTGHCLLVAVM